jgi:hypothetical protein
MDDYYDTKVFLESNFRKLECESHAFAKDAKAKLLHSLFLNLGQTT